MVTNGKVTTNFYLWHLILGMSVLSVALALTGLLGMPFLTSIAVGVAVSALVGGIIGFCRGRFSHGIGGGLVGAFLAHLLVLAVYAISPFADNGPWSLYDYAIVAPLGVACGALVATSVSREGSMLRAVLVGCLIGPPLGALWGCGCLVAIECYTAFERGYFSFRFEHWYSHQNALIWAVHGLVMGGMAGGVIGLMVLTQRASQLRKCGTREHSHV